MKNLSNLFKIVQLTRAQVQYGYLLSGIPKSQLPSLAEHHYLVTFIAWQIALNLKQAGANIDVQKVLEYALVHDLGELMGGDVSALYGKVNPKAKKFAKAFEEENQKYLSKFFGNNAKQFKQMSKEILDAKCDEALIAKVADYMECAVYKVYVNNFRKSDIEFNQVKIEGFIKKMKDKTAKKLLQEFLTEWLTALEDKDYIKILGLSGKDESPVLVYE